MISCFQWEESDLILFLKERVPPFPTGINNFSVLPDIVVPLRKWASIAKPKPDHLFLIRFQIKEFDKVFDKGVSSNAYKPEAEIIFKKDNLM